LQPDRAEETSVIFPRFRSKERDAKSDVARLEIIHAALSRAIAEAQLELTGLLGRLEEERARAAFMFDELDDLAADDDSDTVTVSDSEKFLVRGDRRRLELEGHLAFLRANETRVSDEVTRLQQGF
jgi:hypothetical protein